MAVVYSRPRSIEDVPFHYCPGCGHSIVHKLIGECIDELAILENTVLVAPVGCAVNAYNYFKCDTCEAAHGRAAAVATGLKRSLPDNIVISYQGDGDLASIGMAETIHAANRGEKITIVFINNTIYGMTSGQMAPTTLIGQKTTTSTKGRNDSMGFPIDMCKLISTLEAPVYVVRSKVTSAASALKTKKHIKRALTLQKEGKGYTFVEILSNCNTNWKMTPLDSNKWIDSTVEKVFPLGVFVDKFGEQK
ncbi:MAG: thiamine pyrophosphate-dependent enzyme [Spirochaetota bacterium]